MKGCLFMITGIALSSIGFTNEGLWPWILFCMVGGGCIGHGFTLMVLGE